jgi:hypothetical protein
MSEEELSRLAELLIARENENGHFGWASFTCITYEAQCQMFQDRDGG